jgi:hypothetical protein
MYHHHHHGYLLLHHHHHHDTYMHATTEQADSAGPHDEAAAEGTEGSEGELRSAHQSENQLPGD